MPVEVKDALTLMISFGNATFAKEIDRPRERYRSIPVLNPKPTAFVAVMC